jgi:hypothetical protein
VAYLFPRGWLLKRGENLGRSSSSCLLFDTVCTRFSVDLLSEIYSETIVANPSAESPPTNPDHDILEVNGYLISGLVTSKIDGWFTGSLPQFNPGDLSYFRPPQNPGKALEEVLQLARAALQDPSQTSWQPVGFLLKWIFTSFT